MPILILVKLLASIGLGRCHLSTLIILREHMTLNLLDSLSTFLIISSLQLFHKSGQLLLDNYKLDIIIFRNLLALLINICLRILNQHISSIFLSPCKYDQDFSMLHFTTPKFIVKSFEARLHRRWRLITAHRKIVYLVLIRDTPRGGRLYYIPYATRGA